MAVTITAQGLRQVSQVQTDIETATRLLAVSTEMVNDYASDVPDASSR